VQQMVIGPIGLSGVPVPWIVVLAIKHEQEPALIQNQNIMALIVVQMTMKHKFVISNHVQ